MRLNLRPRTALAATALAMAASSAAAQSSYERALAACRLAASAASTAADPTAFKCDWRTVLRGAPGASLTGRYQPRAGGITGALTIVDLAGGKSQIAASTVHKASANTCTVVASGSRGNDDVLVATAPDAPGCSIRIVSTRTPNVVRVTSSNCSGLCGVRASFDGEWRLQR